jgi:hypothetical protein
MVNGGFHVKRDLLGTRLFADAEAAEDLAQDILDVDPAGDAP